MLADREITNLKPSEKQYKVTDSNCLQIVVTPAGTKTWRFTYRWPRGREGKQKTLTLGIYPQVGLREARALRDEARGKVLKGIDPNEDKKEHLRNVEKANAETFAALAHEWFARGSLDTKKWSSEEHIKHIKQRMERYLIGDEKGKDKYGKTVAFGQMPITKITPRDIMNILNPIEERGAHEMSRRLLQTIRSVFAYALALGVVERNIAAEMKGLLQTRREVHHASLKDPEKIGPLLNAIDDYEGYPVVRCALQLAPLTFVRPGELRGAEWSEIDFTRAQWNIPAERMKNRLPHIVPLSLQSIEVLKRVHEISGEGQYVFPSTWTASRTISENTVNLALRRLGYSGSEMTGHGFRSMASTLLNEMKFDRDCIERQLAHVDGSVRGAYNAAEWLDDRREMMQEWADFLDRLRKGQYVVPRRRVMKLDYQK